MFGNSLFTNDPFFSGHLEGMQQMERTMDAMMGNLMNPFGFLGAVPAMPAIGYDRDYSNRGERQNSRQLMLHQQRPAPGPYGGLDYMFGGMFGGFGMMPSMHNMIQQQMQEAQNDPNSTFFSQSTVMSYQNTGDGRPKVYQATTAQNQANGVREMRKSVRDSEKGIEKMLVGRTIGERAQVITKQRDTSTGNIEEDKELVNFDEEEEEEFNREFQTRVSQAHLPRHNYRAGIAAARRDAPLALTQEPHSHRPERDQPRHPKRHQDSSRKDKSNGFHGKKNDKKQKSVRF